MRSPLLQVVAGFFRKEFSQTLRDPVMRGMILLVPLIQMTLFGYALNNEFKNLKLAVVRDPGDAAARRLEQRFYSSDRFIRAEAPDAADPEKLLRAGRADAVMIMPRGGLTRGTGRGEGADIQLLIDASNASKARSLENYAGAILRKFLVDEGLAPPTSGPVEFDVRVLYNPELQTSWFLVPGVMTMIICLITIILTAMSIAREKELGTLENIIAVPLTNTEIILGKTVPFLVLGLLDTLIVVAAGVLIFNVPIRGPLILMAAALALFVCVTVSIGILISTFSANQQQAMMGAFMFIFPANLLSGIMFPVENMPLAIKIIAYLDPLKYFVDLLRNIMLKGAGLPFILFNMGILTVMSVAALTVAVKRFHQTLN